jgi:CHASE3 domain sensor protein
LKTLETSPCSIEAKCRSFLSAASPCCFLRYAGKAPIHENKHREKIALAFALVLAVFVTISFVSYHNTTRMIQNYRLVSHTQDVLVALDDAQSAIVDAETGQRGYILTGEESFLEPYTKAISEIDSDLENLQRLTADNPNQQRRIALLKPLASAKLENLDQTITVRRDSGFEAAQEIISTGYGKRMMDDIRKITAEMEGEERRLLKIRRRNRRPAPAARWRHS